ncbi:MAG: hypothetical protein QOG52_2078 [Frankiaceae bacterium]|nr:hypothetical protein [Frankiaceae bacterium]
MQSVRLASYVMGIAMVAAASAVPETPAAWGAASATLTSLAVDRSSVAPVGLTPQMVTVTAHLTSPAAIDPACGYQTADTLESGGPFVELTRTAVPSGMNVARVPATAWAGLRLVGGTATDGDWAAAVAVPSTWTGTWEISRVFVCASDPVTAVSLSYLDVDPRTTGMTAAFSVAGSHVPRLSLGYSVLPRYNAPAFVAQGRLVDSATGLGLAGIDLWGCRNEGCPDASYFGQYTGIHLVTDAFGYYKWRTVEGDITELHLWSPDQPASTGYGTERVSVALRLRVDPPVVAAITATPAAGVAKAGTTLTVNGQLRGPCCGQRKLVKVQMMSGAQWRTVATALTRANGRWTASIRVLRGSATYRGFFSDVAGGWAPVSGRPFRVTGI